MDVREFSRKSARASTSAKVRQSSCRCGREKCLFDTEKLDGTGCLCWDMYLPVISSSGLSFSHLE